MATYPVRAFRALVVLAFPLLVALPTATFPPRPGDRSEEMKPLESSAAAASPQTSRPPAHVLTQRNDHARSGGQLTETVLTPATVTPARFGKLFARTVDGEIYAQPLYVSSLVLGGESRARNVVFVATQHNSVYAFDADDPAASTPLWHVNLGRPVPSAEIGSTPDGLPYRDINTEIGITSSPVIDLKSRTLWVVAKTRDDDGALRQMLAALDISSGKLKKPGKAEIRASVRGNGIGSKDGALSFDARTSNQRSGLLLSDGVIFIAWGSHADIQPYHGWIMAYDATTLKQLAAWSTTPDGEGGGIWMSGTGLSADNAGNIYCVVGDGTFSAAANGRDYGDSFVKLRLTGKTLTVRDWFTPHDEAVMNLRDKDLGSTGAVLSADGRYVFGGSKLGWVYQLSATDLGRHRPAGDTQVESEFQVGRGSIYGTPLNWDDPLRGSTLFVWASYDRLKAFRADSTGRLESAPVSQSIVTAPEIRPGGFLSLSANGDTPGTAIVWVSHSNASLAPSPGVLRAFDASDLSRELWSSEHVPERDRVGSFAKFCSPTIANGKVYLATFSGRLNVYGMLP